MYVRRGVLAVVVAGCANTGGQLEVATPELPDLTPDVPAFTCRTGWSDTEVLGNPVCQPFPNEWQACSGATYQRIGQATCEPITRCPDDGWPADLDEDAAFVRFGDSGVGTRTSPFGSLDEALQSGASVIALAAGVYVGNHVLTRDLRIVGTCADQTTLLAADATPALTVQGGNVEVRNLRVSSPDGVGILVQAGELDAEGLWVHDFVGEGIHVDGPEATALVQHSLFSEGAPSEIHRGYGLRATDQATLRANALTFRDLPGGMLVEAPGIATDVIFLQMAGRGVSIFDGDLTLDGAAFYETLGTPITCINSTASAADIVMDGIGLPPTAELGGNAVLAAGDSDCDAQRLVATNVDGTALHVTGGARLDVQDLVMDSGLVSTQSDGGSVLLERGHLAPRGTQRCVTGSTGDGPITLRDVRCEHPESDSGQPYSPISLEGATLHLQDSVIGPGRGSSLWTDLQSGSLLTMRDVHLSGDGQGTAFENSTVGDITVDLQRVRVTGANQLFNLQFVDLLATDVIAEQLSGRIGEIQGGTIDLERVNLKGSDDGLSLTQTTALLSDVTLSTPMGTGLWVSASTTVQGSGVRIEDVTQTGLYSEGRVVLDRLQVTGAPGQVGVSSQGEFSDLTLTTYRIDDFETPLMDDGARSNLQDGVHRR